MCTGYVRYSPCRENFRSVKSNNKRERNPSHDGYLAFSFAISLTRRERLATCRHVARVTGAMNYPLDIILWLSTAVLDGRESRLSRTNQTNRHPRISEAMAARSKEILKLRRPHRRRDKTELFTGSVSPRPR